MTAFAASLFVFAAFTSGWAIVASWLRFGASVKALPAQLSACPRELVVHWRSVERTWPLSPIPVESTPSRVVRLAPGLEWPQSEASSLPLAA
ncbi:hypothetical protein WSK_3911 [Novosphingobium sp. Rr 2-17]|nr:hypothetical protein WSK_3911 [Novosphingobium sp. Rr 2-17]